MNNMPAQKTVIFDVDGTLADIDHRRPILERDPHDWKNFFDAMGEDTPNAAVVALYQLVWNSDDYLCVIVSGRPESYRTLTEQWLTWNGIPYDRLIMRSTSDQRADHVIKEEILDRLLSEGSEIAFVVDDRKSVVEMWRRRGITCFQCEDYNG